MIPIRITNTYALSPIESQPVWGAQRIARGLPLYRDYRESLPLAPLSYGALTYLIPGWIAKYLGTSDPVQISLIGRLQSLSGFIMVVIVTICLMHRFGVRKIWRILPAFTWLLIPYIGEFIEKHSPDMPAIGFSLLGFLLAYIGWDCLRSSKNKIFLSITLRIWGIICWIIAFHFKPIVAIGPVLLIYRRMTIEENFYKGKFNLFDFLNRYSEIILFPILLLFSVVLSICLTGGLWKLNAIDSLTSNRFSFQFALDNLKAGSSTWIIPTLFACLVIIGWFFSPREPLTWSATTLTVIEFISMSKQGSGYHYLAGSLYLWSIISICNFYRLHPSGAADEKMNLWRYNYLLVIVVVMTGTLLSNRSEAKIVTFDMPFTSRKDAEEFSELVLNKLGISILGSSIDENDIDQIISLDPYLAMLWNQSPPFLDPYHASLLEILTYRLSDEIGRPPIIISGLIAIADTRYHEQPVFPVSLTNMLKSEYRAIGIHGWFVLWLRNDISLD